MSYKILISATVACGGIYYSIHENEDVGKEHNNTNEEADQILLSVVAEQQKQRNEDIFKEARKVILQAKEEHGYPGCSITVMKKGKIVWSQGFGYADVENLVPMTSKHMIRIASLSKALTATAVGLLYEQGKLDLDAPIQKYLPDFLPPNPLPPSEAQQANTGMTSTNLANANGNPQANASTQPQEQEKLEAGEAAKRITTRLLTGHLGGIRHYGNPGEFTSQKNYANVIEALDVFKNDQLVAIPGTKYVYTTFGWTVISAIIQVASGEDFLKYMQTNVFQALGMKNTVADMHDPIIPNRAKHYRRSNGKLVNAPWVDNSIKWAGGGFLSNTEDLVIFGNAMIKAELLKPETVALMFTSQKTKSGQETGYGIGWAIDSQKKIVFSAQDGERTVKDWTVSHGGGAVGASSTIMLLPEEDIVVAIIVNIEGAATRPAAEKISSLFKQYQPY